LDRLLALNHNYVRVLARAIARQRYASDLLEETFLNAHRDFGQFLGATQLVVLTFD